MDVRALQLCARFALMPNQLGYCGLDSAPAKFKRLITRQSSKSAYGRTDKQLVNDVTEELKKFPVLYPYLKTIAEVANLDKFSYPVIEAYWLGNDLLNQFKMEHYDLLLKNFAEQGVPDWLVNEMKGKKPKAFIPIHLFNILHVGVGRVTGSVPFNLESVNNCMVRWGQVVSATKLNDRSFDQKKQHMITGSRDHKVLVKLKSLELKKETMIKRNNKNSSYNLHITDFQALYIPDFVPDLKVGDKVGVHWGFVAKVLEEKEIVNLEKWTQKILSSLT